MSLPRRRQTTSGREGDAKFEALLESVTEQREAERRLRENEWQLRTAQRMAHLGSWLFEVSRNRVSWSDELYRIYGIEPGDPRGGSIESFELIHPKDRERVRAAVRKAVGEGGPLDVEYRIVRPDGRERILHSQGELIVDSYDGSIRMIGTAQDITDRRLAQRQLAEQSAFLATILGQAADAVVVCDAKENLVFVNAAAQRMTHLDWGPSVLSTSPDVWGSAHEFSGEPIPAEEWSLPKALRGETTVGRELRMVRTDGSHYDIRISTGPVRSANGEIIGAVATFADITEWKRADERLRESQRQLSTLMSNLPGMAYRCRNDPSWTVEFVSDGCLALTGHLPEDLIGNRRLCYADLIHVDDRDRVWEEVQVAIRERRPFQLTYRIRDAVGAEKWVWEQGQEVSSDGDTSMLEGFVTDVTERHRALEELAQARDEALAASRLKSAFLANISHEIRTPLNIMLGYAALVAEYLAGRGDTSQDRLLAGIERAGQRLTDTIHQVLDYSRIEAGGFVVEPATFDLAAVLEPLVDRYRSLAVEKGLRFSCEMPARPVRIRFDAHCLTGALRSLLDNAVKFTERGEVAVRFHRDPDGLLFISVRDTGVGIGKEFLPHLFEPFTQEEMGYTRSFEGSGIGLPLARRYLELNGARLSVKTRKRTGSTFTIHFSDECLQPSAATETPPRSMNRTTGAMLPRSPRRSGLLDELG